MSSLYIYGVNIMKKVLLVLSLVVVLSTSVFATNGDFMIAAAANGDLAKIEKYLNSGVHIDARANNGWSALIMASCFDYLEIVEMLVNKGADIDARDNYGMTALIWASANGCSSVVNFLINSKADLNAKDNIGRTALILALANRHTETVKILIDSGADVHAVITSGDYRGYTALMIAEEQGYDEMSNLLKEAGAK